MAAAAIVVANPVAPPVRDLQISATQLSNNPEALIPFDKNLLKSISQPSATSNFNVALVQILGALAAEADRIGTAVNSGANTPVAPAAAGLSVPVYAPLPAEVGAGVTMTGAPSAASTAVVPAAVATTTPVIQQVVSVLSAETTYLGNKVVEAAYAAVNALVNTPDLIFKAVQAVIYGDLATAFATVVQAVKAFIDSGLILVSGIDPFIPPTSSAGSAGDVAAGSSRVAAPPATAAAIAATDPAAPIPQTGGGKPRQTKDTGNTGNSRHATTSPIVQPQPTARSSASTPGAGGNSSRSAAPATSDSADQPTQKGSGADKPGSASSGRSQNASSRGASSGA